VIYRLIVPGTFEDFAEVRVLEWHVEPGESFTPGMLIVELETHKAVIEVRAGQTGVLRVRAFEEGGWCPRDGVLAVVADGNDEPLPSTPEALDLMAARFALA
jgi:pyruvate/2-oxoglutarate dehydrogenase complex dihydrolipoamide acyltransferase (E2) component